MLWGKNTIYCIRTLPHPTAFGGKCRTILVLELVQFHELFSKTGFRQCSESSSGDLNSGWPRESNETLSNDLESFAGIVLKEIPNSSRIGGSLSCGSLMGQTNFVDSLE